MKRLYVILASGAILLIVLGMFFFSGGDYRHELAAYKLELLSSGEKLTTLELVTPADTNKIGPATRLTNFLTQIRVPTNLSIGMKIVGPGRATAVHTNLNQAEMQGYESNKSNLTTLRNLIGEDELSFVLDYSLGFTMPIGFLAKFKSAENLAVGTALQALNAGDFQEAYQDSLTGLRLVRNYPRDPILISELVRIALAQINLRTTWELLQEQHWSEQQLAQLQNYWQQVDFREAACRSLRMERASGIAEVAKYRMQPNGAALNSMLNLSGILGNGSGSSSGDGLFDDLKDKIKEWYEDHPRFWRWKKSWSYEEELFYLKEMEILIQAADQQRQSGAFFPAFSQLQQALATLDASGNYHTNHMLLLYIERPSFLLYLKKVADNQVAVALTVTVIALERYRLSRGAYPARLEELTPEFLEKVPTDFMDGSPLHYYRRADGTFLLYSVGENGLDDGGDPVGGMPNWLAGRDIVWPTAVRTNAPRNN